MVSMSAITFEELLVRAKQGSADAIIAINSRPKKEITESFDRICFQPTLDQSGQITGFEVQSDILRGLVSFYDKQTPRDKRFFAEACSLFFFKVLNLLQARQQKELIDILKSDSHEYIRRVRLLLNGWLKSARDEDFEGFFQITCRDAKAVNLLEGFKKLSSGGILPDKMQLAFTKYIQALQKPVQKIIHGVPVRSLNKVLVSDVGDDDANKEPAQITRVSPGPSKARVVTEEVDPVNDLVAGLQAKGIKIDEILEGKEPENEKAPRYNVLVIKALNAQICVAPGHKTYVLREPMDFENQEISRQDFLNHDRAYQTCNFTAKHPSAWINSAFYYLKTPPEVLGVQNKKHTFWEGKADSITAAFSAAVNEIRKVPAAPLAKTLIRSEDPEINGKTWNAALMALRHGSIRGLEHVRTLRELFFDICRTNPENEDLVSPEWWDGRDRRQAQSDFLARLSGLAL